MKDKNLYISQARHTTMILALGRQGHRQEFESSLKIHTKALLKKKKNTPTKGARKLERESMLVFLMSNCK